MRDIVELLSHMDRLDVKLWGDGDRLGFSAPPGVLTAALRDELAERKTEILAFLRASEALPTLVPAPEQRNEPFPLTDIQQAYLVGRGEAFDLGGVATHVYFELEQQALDVERLTRAWNLLIARHEMLRAVFLPTGEQRILPQVREYVIRVLDLQAFEDAVERLEAVRHEMSHQVLPADRWPLFDLRVTRVSPRRVVLHVSVDVLIVDGPSMTRLFQEWATLYADPDARLPRLDVSFRDYVLGAERIRETRRYRRSEEYWRARIDTLPPAPDLPVTKAAASGASHRFVRRTRTIDPATFRTLKRRSAEAGITPSGLLFTAYAEVLGTWSRSARFTLNLTLFSRQALHPQVNDIIGDFTTLVLLEVDQRMPASFAERASRLQAQLLRDMDHHHFSGVRVLRELGRRQSGPPRALMPVVFTSGLALGDLGQGASALESLGTMVFGINQTPQVWLDLQVIERGEELVLNWDAVDELFPPGVLDEMFTAYVSRLTELAGDERTWRQPRGRLTPARQLAARAAVNATSAPIDAVCLHELFLQRAAKQPKAYAVIDPRRRIRYDELRVTAGALAHRLLALGLRPGALVAVVMDKGWEQVAAVLAVHMAGGVYLPIDSSLPAERRRYLLEEGGVRHALTQPWLVDVIGAIPGIAWLSVEDGMALSLEAPLPQIARSPDDLAYVIYTSGSTGRPKGVMIDHRGAVNTILDVNRRFNVGPADRVLALSSLGFDLSVYDVFGLLAAGGAVVFPDAARQRDPAHWVDLLRGEAVTIWNTVPATMGMLLDHLGAASHPAAAGEPGSFALRLALLSGDWIPLDLPHRIKARWPGLLVVSLGGATEASIWSIVHVVDMIEAGWRSVPYGRPLTNQSFHALDEQMEPVPTWVTGQLHIGGVGLAKGYFRDPEKTDAAFVLHPVTGEQLYRTGDLGRYLPSGEIEFLGREDSQVKVNGYRIELGEIEETLRALPAVRDAVVVARGERAASKRMVAYVVAAATNGLPIDRSADDAMDPDDADVERDPARRLELQLSQPGVLPWSRGPGVALPASEPTDQVTRAYLARQSHRAFLSEPVPLAALGDLLAGLRQLRIEDAPLPKYLYPSAGSLYPVRTYVHVKEGRVEGLAGGLYYYHPAGHRLAPCGDEAGLSSLRFDGRNRPIFEAAAFSLLLVGALDVMRPMYGSRARDYCLIEAGAIAQLLATRASSCGLGLCPIGRFDTDGIDARLGLSCEQVVLHSLQGGAVPADAVQRWQALEGGAEAAAGAGSPIAPIREALRATLPSYMVPGTFVLLDALPRTSSGKVDRQALPDPDADSVRTATGFVAPRTPLESSVATMFGQVLGQARIGVHDHFFELGGDSLLATRLVARIRESHQIELPIAQFFRTPTVGGVAEYIEVVEWAARREEGELMATPEDVEF